MKTIFLIAILLTAIQAESQNRFKLTDASKTVDVQIDVGTCPEPNFDLCGPVTVDLYRKQSKTPFQKLKLARTQMWDREPKANVTRRYDEQSVINFGDFNFDGVEDLAICDGNNGGYGMPSYRVYLYSKAARRFVFSRSFTRMNDGGLGMFEVNKKKKMLYVYSKSGCCWHQSQGFDVVMGRPRKVYEFTEDAQYGDGSKVTVTTRKLIRGRWRTWVKRVEFSDYYQS
ncbi:MAG: FG-GAP repeat protein [Pyrinomonadaceae bacterium]